MRRALALIEQVIEEYKLIVQRLETLDQVANDVEALYILLKPSHVGS